MAKKYHVIVSRTATTELLDTIAFIAQTSPTIAKQIKADLIQQIQSLEQFPERFQIVLVVRGYDVRHLVYKRGFRILYTVRDNNVYVLHCLRSEQDLDSIFAEHI